MRVQGVAKRIRGFLKKPDIIYIIPLLLLSLYSRIKFAIGFYMNNGGFVKTHDSYWYMDHANEFIQSFKIDFDMNGIFYFGYYGLLALVMLIFKTENVMIILQVVVSALSVLLVYRIAQLVFNQRTAIIAGVIYALSYELRRWSVYILTDSLFVTSLLLVVYFLLEYRGTKKRKYAYLFAASMVYMIVLRPAGLITVVFIVLYLLISMDYASLGAFLRKRLVASMVGALVFIIVSGVIAYKSINGSLGMSFYWNLRWLLYGNYSSGNVFDIPTGYNHKYNAIKNDAYFNNFVLSFFINNWKHVIILYAKRFISFWGELWIWHYHFGRKLQAIQYFMRLMPLLIMVTGMGRAVIRKSEDKALILFVPIISTVLFCMIFFLDSAWRYRVPCLPFSGIFLAYGIDWCISLLINFLKWFGIDRRVIPIFQKIKTHYQGVSFH